jgi:multidrug resistance efflux pump
VRSAEVDTGVDTAEAAVAAARARLAQARESVRSTEAEAAAEVRRAEAALAAAQANLATATRGARPAQRRQAEAAVTQAETAATAARRGLEEAQFLYDRGGLTRAQLEEARTASETARSQLDAAKAALELAVEGASPEERRAAEAAVRQAEAGVAAARAGAHRARSARQDAAAAEAQLRQAEAGLRAARAGRAGRDAAREDVTAAAAALDQARVQWRQTLEQVAATQLVSPVDGVVTLRAAEPGQIAQPGQPLLAVAAGIPVLEAPVSAATVGMLRPGQPVQLTPVAAPGRRLRAVLEHVPPAPEPDGRTYLVRARLSGGRLPPGVRARGAVRVARAADAVLVPAAAVQRTPEGTAIWLAKNGRAERLSVQCGIETDTTVQILSGVASGDTVIVAGTEGLRPGDPVDAGRRSEGIPDFGFWISDRGRATRRLSNRKSKIQNPKSEIRRSGATPRWA